MRKIMRTTWRLFCPPLIIVVLLKIFGILTPGLLSVLFVVFVGCLVLSLILSSKGYRASDKPFRDLIRLRNPFIRDDSGPRPHGGQNAPVRIIPRASRPGFTSGFEPRFLKNIPVPHDVRMHGSPGIGLNAAHNVMSSSAIHAGQIGEENLSKILSIAQGEKVYQGGRNGIIFSVDSFWSVGMPSKNDPRHRDPSRDTDIDCIITGRNKIYLIDAKFYKGGDVTYYTDGNETLYCRDTVTGAQVGDPKHMSRNMNMALDLFRSHYPGLDVEAFVVLIPTDSGTTRIDNVRWPGGIPLIHPADLVRIVSPLSGYNTDRRIVDNITNLLKH